MHAVNALTIQMHNSVILIIYTHKKNSVILSAGYLVTPIAGDK